MWDLFTEYISDGLTVFCTILSFVIPYTIYKVNNRLHQYGDPPWKKDIEKEEG